MRKSFEIATAVLIVGIGILVSCYPNAEERHVDALFSRLRKCEFVVAEDQAQPNLIAHDHNSRTATVESIERHGTKTGTLVVTHAGMWRHPENAWVTIGEVDCGDFKQLAWVKNERETEGKVENSNWISNRTILFSIEVGEMVMTIEKTSWSNGASNVGVLKCAGSGQCHSLGVKLLSVNVVGSPSTGVIGVAEVRFVSPSSWRHRGQDLTCAILFR